jgi:outer membrane protein OmpA-like peptidoglycan-associated protein
MRRYGSVVVLLTIALLLATLLPAQAAPQKDVANCSDHPLFTRMANMRLTLCKTLPFDSFKFRTGDKTDMVVEGRRFEIKYQIHEGFEAPSPLAIIRNHQQAIAQIGGTTLYEDKRYTWLKVVKDGNEIWAQVDTAWGKGYMLTIVERKAMAQEVVASAELFKSGLDTSGHVEVPGIFFDTGKADLKPESENALAEIAKLLQADPGLKVYVVGHTDTTAALDLNLRLSEARAEAVVQALVTRHGIAQARLLGKGVGPLSPVDTNGTEEGRAKNRRVELVKQ